MSRVRIQMSREFLLGALERLSRHASVPVAFIAEVDGRNANVQGHVASNPEDDTLSFTLEVPSVRSAQ